MGVLFALAILGILLWSAVVTFGEEAVAKTIFWTLALGIAAFVTALVFEWL